MLMDVSFYALRDGRHPPGFVLRDQVRGIAPCTLQQMNPPSRFLVRCSDIDLFLTIPLVLYCTLNFPELTIEMFTHPAHVRLGLVETGKQ